MRAHFEELLGTQARHFGHTVTTPLIRIEYRAVRMHDENADP
jgi:hypothetical protein